MKNKYTYFLMTVTFMLITFFGIKYSQSILKIIPLYISIVVMLLQLRVNRYAFLLGGINSVLYAAVYFYYALYGSAFYAITVSFLMQIATFINWGRHSYKKTATVFKTMGIKKFTLFSAVFFCYMAYLLYDFQKTWLKSHFT